MNKPFFDHFETSSTQEREHIAAELKKLYNRFYQEENETFQAMRAAEKHQYPEAQKAYIAAVSKLGAVQAVFKELGIEFSGFYDLEVIPG